MQQQIYQVHDTDELKQCLIDVWYGFEQSVIDDAVDEWHKHLCARICVKEGHFEHLIQLYIMCVVLHIVFVNFVNNRR